MAGEQDVSTLNGLFKKKFHGKLEDLKPEHLVLQKDGFIPKVTSDKLNGEMYAIPTVLRSNQGCSYLGEAGEVASLVAAANGVMKEAQVKGTEIVLRGQMSYGALSRAAAKGEQAFEKASAWLVMDLKNSAHNRLELSAIYGQSGIGTVSAVTDNTTSADLTITEDSFAPAIWTLLEGAKIDSFTGTTKNNTGTLTVNFVDSATRKVNVAYTGTIASDSAASDELYPTGSNSGASVFKEMVGLYKQFAATSGTLFNISRADYTLMKGNVSASTGAITKAKIVEASMLAVDKGALSGLVAMVGTKAWAALWAEDAALRVFDGSYSKDKASTGSKELIYEFIGGSIKVVCHPFVKAGHCFIFNPEDILWVGSTIGPVFEIPGIEKEEFFTLVSGSTAVELQCYCDQAIYALKPAQTVIMTGITYT